MAEVRVQLKNPPAGTTAWKLLVYPWTLAKVLSTTVSSVGGEATFDIPSDWLFPLRFGIQIIHSPPYTLLYQAQSYGPEYPDYVEEFIPSHGSYYYNVATEKFEVRWVPRPPPCSISIDAPDSAQEGETVVVLTSITNNSPNAEVYKFEIFAGADSIGSTFDTIQAGATKSYYAAFIMPGSDITILVWMEVWYPDWAAWNYNNAASKLVSLEVPAATFHLEVNVPAWAAGGYIDPGSGDYPAYSTVTLTAHPLDGYQFTGWGGDASGTDPTYALYMDGDKYVEAYFEPVEVEVPEPEFRQFTVTEYTKR